MTSSASTSASPLAACPDLVLHAIAERLPFIDVVNLSMASRALSERIWSANSHMTMYFDSLFGQKYGAFGAEALEMSQRAESASKRRRLFGLMAQQYRARRPWQRVRHNVHEQLPVLLRDSTQTLALIGTTSEREVLAIVQALVKSNEYRRIAVVRGRSSTEAEELAEGRLTAAVCDVIGKRLVGAFIVALPSNEQLGASDDLLIMLPRALRDLKSDLNGRSCHICAFFDLAVFASRDAVAALHVHSYVPWYGSALLVTHPFALTVPNFSDFVQRFPQREAVAQMRFFERLELEPREAYDDGLLLCYIALGGTLYAELLAAEWASIESE